MYRVFSVVCLVFIALMSQLSGEVKIPNALGDNMVLQRNKPINIWGWSEPGEKVEVSFAIFYWRPD
jgi:sialate O-acetylesterase